MVSPRDAVCGVLGIFGALSVAGCGGKATVADDAAAKAWHSGSRLRARITDGGEGATYFNGWHDRELDLDCEFETADDGKLRCLPAVDYAVLYEDLACEHAVLVVSPGASVPAWAASTIAFPSVDDSGCTVLTDQPSFLVRAFEVLAPSSSSDLYTLNDSGCESASSAADNTIYTLAAVDPGRFVSATEREGEGSGGLAAIVLDAEDGASFVQGFRDTARDAACSIGSWFGAENRCSFGEPAWLAAYYANPDCTDGLAYADPCVTPTIVYGTFYDSCNKWGIHEIGEPYEGPVFRLDIDGSCAAVQDTWWQSHAPYRYGAEISSELPAVQERLVGTGRLRAQRKVAAGVEYELRGYSHFFDTELDTWCSGAPCAPDGKYGFHPGLAIDDGDTFGDVDCTKPLAAWACDGRRDAPIYAVRGTETDALRYRLGAEWAGDIYILDGASCTKGSREPGTTYSELGAEVDPSTLANVVDRVE